MSAASADADAPNILPPGTVESRNNTANKSQISSEIQAFLNGTDGNGAALGFKSEYRTLFTVWMFVTRLPSPSWVDLHPGFLMRGMVYFPVIGTVLGCMYAILSLGLPPTVAACVSVSFGLYVTGCFHEDGLADSADGIGGGWSKSQVLKIMTDSRVGTFGCAALSMFIFAKLQLLGTLGVSSWSLACDGRLCCTPSPGGGGAGPAIIVAQTLSRLSAPYLIRTRDYVAEVGPKSPFYIFMVEAKHLVTWPRVAFASAYSFGVTSMFYGPVFALTLIMAVLILAHIAGRKGDYLLGGVMGDFLGGTICLCDLFVLVVIMAKGTIVELYQYCVEALSLTEAPDGLVIPVQLIELWNNERTRPLIHFGLLVTVLSIWCSVVGPNDMYNREDSAETSGTEGSGYIAPCFEANGEPLTRQVAEGVLTSPDSTFQERHAAAQTYLDSLAKPVGSLGTLEEWAARLSALQRTTKPTADNVACLIFAGDHGVAKSPEEGGEGCSLYPQAVTRGVLASLEKGVAGASVLARTNGVKLRVIDVGVAGNLFEGKVVNSDPDKLHGGTRNFCSEPAMTAEECSRCMQIGRKSLIEVVEQTSSKVVCLGEVGIGNTTSSSALIAALTGQVADSVCGGGAYATKTRNEDAVSKKIHIVKRALKRHGRDGIPASVALANLGGAEIAAMAGAMLEASERDIAVLVDGFIATAAALVAVGISPNACHCMFLTTNSAEKGQKAAIETIQAAANLNYIPMPPSPVLSMGLRMGEGSAAIMAVPIIRSSAAVMSDMATIQDVLG